ncbi:hypothetical protein ABEB36_000918 [Hypothenemus hampei]|uniref:Uncharacterized protein n=1 Tax=Hypothenemus hampei TaxID=57062 RepID=A0ABD1FCW6_HYPHA
MSFHDETVTKRLLKLSSLDKVLRYYYKGRAKVKDTNLCLRDLWELDNQVYFHTTIHASGYITCKRDKRGEKSVTHPVFLKLSPSIYLPPEVLEPTCAMYRFHKEQRIYTELIKDFTKYQLEMTPDCPIRMRFDSAFPTCYGTRPSIPNERTNMKHCGLTILENVYALPSNKCFMTLDSRTELSDEIFLAVLDKMTILHAVSLVIKYRNPQLYSEKLPLLQSSAEYASRIQLPSQAREVCYRYLSKQVMKLDRVQEFNHYLEESRNIRINENEKWMGFVHGMPCQFNFRWERQTENIIDIKFLDLQYALHRHVLSDLAFLLLTTAPKSLFLEKYLLFTRRYHRKFVFHLRFLGFSDDELESYEEFEKQLKLCLRKELLRSVMMLKYLSCIAGTQEIMRPLATWPSLPTFFHTQLQMDDKLFISRCLAIFKSLRKLRILPPLARLSCLFGSDTEDEDSCSGHTSPEPAYGGVYIPKKKH